MSALVRAREGVESVGRGIVAVVNGVAEGVYMIVAAVFAGFCFLIGAAFFALIYGAMALVIFAILKSAWIVTFGS